MPALRQRPSLPEIKLSTQKALRTLAEKKNGTHIY